jgi:hypothetical protein
LTKLEIDKLQLLEAIESGAIESSWGRVRLRVEAYRLHLESCKLRGKGGGKHENEPRKSPKINMQLNSPPVSLRISEVSDLGR